MSVNISTSRGGGSGRMCLNSWKDGMNEDEGIEDKSCFAWNINGVHVEDRGRLFTRRGHADEKTKESGGDM